MLCIIAFNGPNNQKIAEKKSLLEEKCKKINDFSPTKKIGTEEFLFAIDETNRKVAIVEHDCIKTILFKQILSVEYIENTTTVASKSSARTIGGAVVGGVIAGGAGAIVGGLSGDTMINKNVSLMQVKIGIRNIQEPSVNITLFGNGIGRGYDSNGSISEDYYVLYKKMANDIVDSLSVIIDIIDKEEKNNIVQVTESGSQSIADELFKLVKLKEIGAITENEFEEQKQKLLNK